MEREGEREGEREKEIYKQIEQLEQNSCAFQDMPETEQVHSIGNHSLQCSHIHIHACTSKTIQCTCVPLI